MKNPFDFAGNLLTGPGPAPAITWKRCLVLSIPALLIGFYIRAELMRAIPWAFFGADSGSYAHTMRMFWMEGGLTIPEKRRWLYPLFLLPMPLSPFSVLSTVALLQHLLGLAAVLALGWIVGHVTRFPGVWIPLLTCLYAVWPRVLWYEHEVIAEGIFLPVFLLATALAFPLSRLADKTGLFYFLLAIGAVALLKPHGKVLWVVMLALLFLVNRRPLQWGLRNWLTVTATAVLMATAGSASQGSLLLLTSTLPLVPTEGSWPEYRRILQPLIEETRADLPNYVFLQYKYKRPLKSTDENGALGAAWAKLAREKGRFKTMTTALAVSGIVQSPVTYAEMVAKKVLLAAAGCGPNPRLQPQVFWTDQTDAEDIVENAAILPLLYGVPEGQWNSLVGESRERTFVAFPFLEKLGAAFAWSAVEGGFAGYKPKFKIRWTGWLVLGGLLVSLAPSRFFSMLMIWAPSAAYLIVCFGVGDALQRYLHPVEWAGFVLIAVFLDQLLQWSAGAVRRITRSSQPPLAQAQ